MRNLTPDMAAEYSSKNVAPVILADLVFDSGTVYMWSGIGNLNWNGNDYIGGGNLVGISAIEETQDLIANGIVCSLNGVSSANVALALGENVRRRPFRLYLGAVSTSYNVLNEDGDGYIELEDGSGYVRVENEFLDSPYRIFSGLMDIIESSNDGKDHILKLSVENILLVGQRPKRYRYTDMDQKKRFPNDRGFELINRLQDKELIW